MIKLMKNSFYKEAETKKALIEFIAGAEILSMNKECAKFEQAFARWQGRERATFVSSGSMANLVLIQSLLNLGRLKKGDKVAVSALTWATNVMPIIQLGLVPVVLDCEFNNLNISSVILEKAIAVQDIKCLFITNVLGLAGDLPVIAALCQKNGIILLEDNCESLGSSINGQFLGNFGLASTFSTFVGHHMSTIEGGLICTDDEELHEMVTMVRAHGWDRNLSGEQKARLQAQEKTDGFYACYTFYHLAYNARPTEIQGFIGNTQLPCLDEIISIRQENFRKFIAVAGQNDDFLEFDLSHMDKVSNFAMPVICRDQSAFKKYAKRFADHAVEIRPIIAGDISQQPFFKKEVGEEYDCPNARHIHENGFYFANNPDLTGEEINILCELLKK